MTDPILIVNIPDKRPRRYRLTDSLTLGRTLVTLGKKCDEVYNCVDIDSEGIDPFQCQFTKDNEGNWTIQHGQIRTECPRGLISFRQIACNTCPGRCVNIRPGRPHYFWRYPEQKTFLNDIPLDDQKHLLNPGDIIRIADVNISVEDYINK